MLAALSTTALPSDTENATLFSTGASLSLLNVTWPETELLSAAPSFALMLKLGAVSPPSCRKRTWLAAICAVVKRAEERRVGPAGEVWNAPWLTVDTV